MPLSRFSRDAASLRAGIALGQEVGGALAPKLLNLPECTPAELQAPRGAELRA
jgi:hypothetical protein